MARRAAAEATLANDVPDLAGDRGRVCHGARAVAPDEVAGPGEGYVLFVVLVALARAKVVAAVGLDYEPGIRPEEVDLVVEERDVDGGKREAVVATDLDQQILEP